MGKKSAKRKSEFNGANLGFEAKFWVTANKLRNNMDTAEYKHAVLGLNFLQDILGRVCEDFLTRFPSAERKNCAQFYTPRCVIRVFVEMLALYKGRAYDPCSDSAGMFVQNEKFVEEHGGRSCLGTTPCCYTGTFAKPACSVPAHTSANRVFRHRMRWREAECSKNTHRLIRYQYEAILRYHATLSAKSSVFAVGGLSS